MRRLFVATVSALAFVYYLGIGQGNDVSYSFPDTPKDSEQDMRYYA